MGLETEYSILSSAFPRCYNLINYKTKHKSNHNHQKKMYSKEIEIYQIQSPTR